MEVQTVLVTGANRGLGLALTHALLARRQTVIATVRNNASGNALRIIAESNKNLIVAMLDLNDPASIDSLAQRCGDDLPLPDTIVNNAGMVMPVPVEGLQTEDMQNLFQLHLFGPVQLLRQLLPAFRQRRSGHIVNISSLSAHIGLMLEGAYSASKAAMEKMAESLYHEVQPFGINVTTVVPGAIQTDMPDAIKQALGSIRPQAYQRLADRMLESMNTGDGASGVDEIADEIANLSMEPPQDLVVPVGKQARQILPLLRGMDEKQRVTLQEQFSLAAWWKDVNL